MLEVSLQDISKYLTEDVIDRAFKLKTGSQDRVTSLEVSRGASVGDGLVGAIYRITVQGKIHKASFIVKSMAKDPLLQRTLSTGEFFQREIVFFSELLPVLKEMQKSLGASERIQSYIPICYAYHSNNEEAYLLLEDLKEKNCVAITTNPTKSERDSVLKTLAHLHAVSIALRVKKPNLFNKITEDLHEMYYTDVRRKFYSGFLQRAIEIDLKTLEEFEEETSVYYKKFSQLCANDPYGKMIRLSSQKYEHCAINHGDAWTPNFMYSAENTVAVDFQMARCCSPVLDLSVLVILCCMHHSDKSYALESIAAYHNALAYFLKDMSINVDEVYSWDDFMTDFKKFGKFGLLGAITSIPLLCSDKCDVMGEFVEKFEGLEKIPLEDLWQLTPFKSEDEKLALRNVVRVSVDLGLL